MAHKVTKSKIDKVALVAFTKTVQRKAGAGDSLFLSGFISTSEQIKIGRRILIAEGILRGKTHMEINETLRVSPNTFTQIKRQLTDTFPEYKAYSKQRKQPVRKETSPVTAFSYEDLKRKYPLHFLLFSLGESLFKK